MALEIKVPTVGESISEVTISRWLKKDGDWVEMDDVLAELESDKATFELNAEKAGVLKTLGKEGDTIAVGAVICSIDTDAPRPAGSAAKEEKKADAPKAETPAAPAKNETKTEEKTYASGTPSPAAGKILAEKGIDPATVNGTGKGGRITKADALAASPLKTGLQSTGEVTRDARLEKMTSLRKTLAKRLVAAKNQTAMLTTFNEVDMKPIMDIRARYKESFQKKHKIGLGFMGFFTKAVCNALSEWPAVNAMIDGDEIIYNNYCDISIAVSTPKGLTTPVIRNAESMTLGEIEMKVDELDKKGREYKLTLDEKSG